MRIVEITSDFDQEVLRLDDATEPSDHERDGVSLTDEEWADYQRVQQEYTYWQTKLAMTPVVKIAADPELQRVHFERFPRAAMRHAERTDEAARQAEATAIGLIRDQLLNND